MCSASFQQSLIKGRGITFFKELGWLLTAVE